MIFVTDFDGTITSRDTTDISYRLKQSYIDATEKEKSDFKTGWDIRTGEFLNGYRDILTSEFEQKHNAESFELEKFEEFMKKLDQNCLNSRNSLAKNQTFCDYNSAHVLLLAPSVEYHESARDVMAHLSALEDVQMKILSVNWCPDLIYECLKDYVTKEGIVSAKLPVAENDFGQVATSFGKREWIERWSNEFSGKPIIYVGDSLTDSLALLKADYGILFASNESTKQVLKTFGITLLPLDKENVNNCKTSNALLCTNSWMDIKEFVQSLRDGF